MKVARCGSVTVDTMAGTTQLCTLRRCIRVLCERASKIDQTDCLSHPCHGMDSVKENGNRKCVTYFLKTLLSSNLMGTHSPW